MFEKSIVHYKMKTLISAQPHSQKLDDQRKTQQLFFQVGYDPDNVNYFEYQYNFK